ncbi:carboxypeptidase family protein [Archangium gephyra]|uniref:Carboxypeptidase family protein n=1 Tax=Archangium gephyra TaxID=48 RepID=A0ABX9JW10_9BACT|nr:carboxypeptidase family protein [Archangium gephyra]
MLASGALAQGVTGSAVTGTVTTQENEPLPSAVVQLRNMSTGTTFTAVTGSTGTYLLDNIPPGGPYTLTVNMEGFYPATRTGMQLVLGQRFNIDLKLRQFEEFQEEMTVTAEPVDELQDQGRTGPSMTMDAEQMTSLPLAGRNFTDLISTTPQVSGNAMAGQNSRYNNIQVDGAAYNDIFGLAGSGTPGGQAGAKPISIEAIQSFVVQVSPFDVRYGNFAGGMVNAITKSGTNDFHGSVFGYTQNKSLAGRQSDPTFLGYNIWQFGGSLGGPIIKDKVHFFIATDLQERSSAFGNQFQIGGVNEADDRARAGFTQADADRFSRILADKYGVSNPGTALGTQLRNPDRNVFAKISTGVIPNSYLEISYNFVGALQDSLLRAPTGPSLPTATSPGRLRDGYQLSNSGYAQTVNTHTARAKLTSTFLDGKLSNEFLAGFSILRDARDAAQDIPLILVKAGKLGANDSWLAAGSERFSQLNKLDQDIFQIQDSLTLVAGDHQLTAGTSTEFFRLRNAFLQAATGVWAFDSLDAFEAGTPSAFQRRFGVSPLQEPGTAAFTVAQPGFYLQDNWTPFKNLTLTPGIRLDVPFLSRANTNERLVNNEALPINTGEVPSGNILWSPRLGVNWDVEGNSNTIVRGGVGVFSGRPPYVWVSNAYSINGLSQVELTCQGATIPAFTLDPNAQPFTCDGATAPSAPTNQGEIDYFDPKTRYPQNFRVAVGADRRLPWGIIATADLLYTQDINGWYTTDENLVNQGQSGEGRSLYGTFAATGFRANSTRRDPANLAQAIRVFNKNGGRVYNGTLQLQKQIQDILDVSVGYSYTDAKDLISLTSAQALSNFQFAPVDGSLENRNLRPSAFDRTHRLTFTATGQLPLGFNAGIIYTGQSGQPYSWTVNGDVNADGINGNDLAFIPADPSQISLQGDAAAQAAQYEALSRFIDSQQCLKESKGRIIERGACRNPWQNLFNVRLGWNAPEFVKGQRLEVQADIFNVLNFLYPKWGLFEQEAQFENHASSFLRAVGYDAANNRPIYSFTEPAAVRNVVYSSTSSRWRIQLGARYVF